MDAEYIKISKQVDVLLNSKRKKPHRKYFSVLFTLLLCLSLLASAGLIQYYAHIDASITATPSILVDGEESPLIDDVLELQVGESINVSHSIENLNSNYTYVLQWASSNVTEGLNVTYYWNDGVASEVTVAPVSMENFTINYFVVPNAEPGLFEADIEVVFVEAYL